MNEKIQFLIRESKVSRQYAINLINQHLRPTWKDTLDTECPHTLEMHLSILGMSLHIFGQNGSQFPQISLDRTFHSLNIERQSQHLTHIKIAAVTSCGEKPVEQI